MSNETKSICIEWSAFAAIVLAFGLAVTSCGAGASVSQSSQIIDIDPRAFNTWVSGRFFGYPSEFNVLVNRLDERDVSELFRSGL